MVYRKTYRLVSRSFFKRKVLGNRKRDSFPLRRIDNFKNFLKFIEIINSNLNKTKTISFCLRAYTPPKNEASGFPETSVPYN